MKVVAAAISQQLEKDDRHHQKMQTFNCGCMLCQSGESCSGFILYRMRGCIQEFEDASNPSWLDVVILIRYPA